jgi:hypothetical protein
MYKNCLYIYNTCIFCGVSIYINLHSSQKRILAKAEYCPTPEISTVL